MGENFRYFQPFEDNNGNATTLDTQDGSSAHTHQIQDCAPLFFYQFKHGSTRPIDVYLSEKATKLSEWLSHHPDAIVLIEGHADSTGPEEFNLLISHRRALAVSKLLATAGVKSEQMITQAFGEYSPILGLPPESEKNRRVSLRVKGAQACQDASSNGDKQ